MQVWSAVTRPGSRFCIERESPGTIRVGLMSPEFELGSFKTLLDAPSPAVLAISARGSVKLSPVWFRYESGYFEVVIADGDVSSNTWASKAFTEGRTGNGAVVRIPGASTKSWDLASITT